MEGWCSRLWQNAGDIHTYTHTKLYFEWSYSFLYHQFPFSTNLRLKRIGMCLQWTCLDYFMLSLFPERQHGIYLYIHITLNIVVLLSENDLKYMGNMHFICKYVIILYKKAEYPQIFPPGIPSGIIKSIICKYDIKSLLWSESMICCLYNQYPRWVNF